MTRAGCLNRTIDIVTRDRNNQYGEPEDNFTNIAGYWNTYIKQRYHKDITLSPTDIAVMMALFKIGRMEKFKEDNFVDACGYLACGAELSEP